MGPQASLELHSRILTAASIKGARNGEDFPEILHASLPIKDFINGGELQAAADMINLIASRLYLWRRTTDCYRMQHRAYTYPITG